MTDQDTHASIKDRIRSSFSVLSPAERQVARNILSDYPASCLGSVASIAKSSGVSAPSVVRFAKTLRFASFVEFKEAVLDEIASQSKGPLNRARTLPTETHTLESSKNWTSCSPRSTMTLRRYQKRTGRVSPTCLPIPGKPCT